MAMLGEPVTTDIDPAPLVAKIPQLVFAGQELFKQMIQMIARVSRVNAPLGGQTPATSFGYRRAGGRSITLPLRYAL